MQREPGSREANLGALFTVVLTRGPVSRRDAAKITGLSPAAVTKLARPMLDSGYLVEHDGYIEGPGRPLVPLSVAADRHYAAGIKVTGGELIGVLVDLRAEVRASVRTPLETTSVRATVAGISELAQRLLTHCPGRREDVLGIGIGVCGHVDGQAGVVRYAPVLGWREIPLASMVAQQTGLAAVIENDVNALAIAEHWFGSARGERNFVLVTVGSGVGCALIINGELWRGVSGAAGEFGHTPVSPKGPWCHCGRKGCLESLISDDAIVQRINARTETPVADIDAAIDLAHRGDQHAQRVFADSGTVLGSALSTVVNLLNPPLVIVSGARANAADLFLQASREELARRAFSSAGQDCAVLLRPLADEIWARGAASAMLRRGVLTELLSLPTHPAP